MDYYFGWIANRLHVNTSAQRSAGRSYYYGLHWGMALAAIAYPEQGFDWWGSDADAGGRHR